METNNKLQNKYTPTDLEIGNISPIEAICTSNGLLNYVTNVLKYTGMGWLSTLLFSLILAQGITDSNIKIINILYLLFGFICSICCIVVSTFIPSIIIQDSYGENIEQIPISKKILYGLLCFGLGMLLAPAIFQSNKTNVIIVPMAIVVTSGMFISLQIVTFLQKDMSVIEYYAPLMSCVSGLILIGIIEIILNCTGYSAQACLLSFGASIISLIVFGALIVVDTMRAIVGYRENNIDTIGCAVSLLLDMINIFVNLLNCISYILGGKE